MVRRLGLSLIPLVGLLGGCATWSNWAGNQRCTPREIVRPADEAALRLAVKNATRLRVSGSGHSWSALVCTDETMVDTRSLTRVLKLDPEARTVKVEAGILLSALDEAVARHGLALATEPTIDEVTAAGAISTASHGTDLASGALSEEVVALEVIDAGGRKVTIEDADRLRAARVGLGSIGVIYSITFRLVPAFNLKIHERVVGENDAFDHLAELLAHNQHVDLFWFVTEHQVFLRTYNRTQAPPRGSSPIGDFIDEWVVKTWIGAAGLAVASKVPIFARLFNAEAPSLFRSQTRVDRSDRIFHRFPGHQRVFSMEYLIPLERTREALAAITASLKDTGFTPTIPPYLRFVGGSGDGDLSPMRGRQNCAIEVLAYVGADGWERFFRDLEPRFLALGGRPHWGKLSFANPRELYPPATWDHVRRLREQLDPNHKFENPLARRLFEPAAPSP